METSDEAPAIEIRGLKSQFGSRVIHENLDLTVQRGEILGVVGGSGSGKSVMLNSIIGLKRPEGGSVRVFGHDIHADPNRRPVLEPDRRGECRGAADGAHPPLTQDNARTG
jgi:ABC-type transporter Mla maintaining outer membrane lipid asymmetry ATPase subunit MlaF